MRADTFPPIHPAKLPINFLHSQYFSLFDSTRSFRSETRAMSSGSCWKTTHTVHWNAAQQFLFFFLLFSLIRFRCDNSVLSVNLDLLWMKRASKWAAIGQLEIYVGFNFERAYERNVDGISSRNIQFRETWEKLKINKNISHLLIESASSRSIFPSSIEYL